VSPVPWSRGRLALTTALVFKNMLPKLEAVLIDRKSSVDRHEYHKRVGLRRAEARASYPQFCAALVIDPESSIDADDVSRALLALPSGALRRQQAIWLPSTEEIIRSNWFVNTLEDADAETKITPDWWHDVADTILDQMDEWEEKVKMSLVQTFLRVNIPSRNADEDEDSDEAGGEDEETDIHLHILERATSLFTCSCTPTPLPYRQFLTHACIRSWEWEYTESACAKLRIGQDVARALLQRFGLSPDSTLAELQGLGRRFVCMCGQSVPQMGVGGDWLSLVGFFVYSLVLEQCSPSCSGAARYD
jgi:hypothetical protein